MRLYIYEHCPYCVKARAIFGLRQHPLDVQYLLNDDADTPTRMIGAKQVPILEWEEGSYLPESMDIVHYIDSLYDRRLLQNRSDERLTRWLEESRDYVNKLAMPRWAQMDLPEFATDTARQYFIDKKEAYIGSFEEHLKNSPALIARATQHLEVLTSLLHPAGPVHGVFTEDDIHVFAVLRSLSCVKGITYMAQVERYRQWLSTQSGVPLHDKVAI